MKMISSAHRTILSIYCLYLISTVLSLSHGMDVPSQGNTGVSAENGAVQDRENRPSLRQMIQRRTCDGFPCMYSHLGTKAGRASLYKTLASFIDDCFTDPECDPGRRKRQDQSNNIRKLIDTPVIDLVRWRMHKDH